MPPAAPPDSLDGFDPANARTCQRTTGGGRIAVVDRQTGQRSAIRLLRLDSVSTAGACRRRPNVATVRNFDYCDLSWYRSDWSVLDRCHLKRAMRLMSIRRRILKTINWYRLPAQCGRPNRRRHHHLWPGRKRTLWVIQVSPTTDCRRRAKRAFQKAFSRSEPGSYLPQPREAPNRNFKAPRARTGTDLTRLARRGTAPITGAALPLLQTS